MYFSELMMAVFVYEVPLIFFEKICIRWFLVKLKTNIERCLQISWFQLRINYTTFRVIVKLTIQLQRVPLDHQEELEKIVLVHSLERCEQKIFNYYLPVFSKFLSSLKIYKLLKTYLSFITCSVLISYKVSINILILKYIWFNFNRCFDCNPILLSFNIITY